MQIHTLALTGEYSIQKKSRVELTEYLLRGACFLNPFTVSDLGLGYSKSLGGGALLGH